MSDESHEPLRIVLFMRDPAGGGYRRAQDVISRMGHRLVGVLTAPGPRGRRSTGHVDFIPQTPANVDIIVSNFPSRWAAMLAPLRPDLIVILGFSWKVPEDVRRLPRLGTVNMHGALLPRYRGRGDWALQWMLRNDEPEYGVTYHWADGDWDTGPILVQGGFPIEDDDDALSLFEKAKDTIIELLPTAIEMAARGEPGTPQPDGGFYVEPIEPEWQQIDWSRPARAVHNQVRGWWGQGAVGLIDGTPTRVLKTQLLAASNGPHPPGAVLDRDGATLTIQCGDGPLRILESQPEPV
jgi:methionyl-tRNA formyltransferase